MASSSQEALTHTHTHTQGEALSLIHKDMEAKAFSSSSSLRLLVHKRTMLQHRYKTILCTKSKNIGWLSMYASCVQLPTTMVSISGLARNLHHIPSITLASVDDVVGADDSSR